MQPSFAQLSFRNGKRQLLQKRNDRFSKIRKVAQQMQQEPTKMIEENITDLDYSSFYPQETKQAINNSLKCPLPIELPPLGQLTISLYRRAGKSVYQCKQFGQKQLDPHMTYESLLMLGHTEAKEFGNYQGLVKEFQRNFKQYLSLQSKDIREMAIIAAGNKILGREEDILEVVSKTKDQFLWILINHVYEGRISCRHLLSFMLAHNQLAFKAFSELTNNVGDDSIDVLTESDPAIDCLMNALDSEPLCRMSLEIICNLLGEGQGHWKLFAASNLLDKCASLLLKGDRNLKRAVLKMLCNFVFEGGAATAVLRHHNLISLLVNMLSSEGSSDLGCLLLNIFSFIVYKGEGTEVFDKLVSAQLLEVCSGTLGISQDLNMSALQLVCGLVELGEKYPNEKDQNVAGLMVSSNQDLLRQVHQLSNAHNNYISGLCFVILDKIEMTEQL